MCCKSPSGSHHGHHHGMQRRGHHSCFCGCHGTPAFQRRFVTQKEQITRLEDYLKELQEEAQAVKEQVDQLKKRK